MDYPDHKGLQTQATKHGARSGILEFEIADLGLRIKLAMDAETLGEREKGRVGEWEDGGTVRLLCAFRSPLFPYKSPD